MKKIIKHFSFLTALVALFALLSVAAFADEPAEPANPAQNTNVDLSLVFSPETELTVYVDNQWSSTLSGTYGFGDTVTLNAPTVDGKTFSHWTADGSIVSYANPLKLTMNAHTTLYAVYANAAPTAKPVAGFTSVTRTNDGGSISFQAIAYPNGGTVTGAGIVYSTSATGEDLKIDGIGVTNEVAKKLTDSTTTMPQSVLDSNNCWMLQITPASGDTVHARAYVTVGGTTTYGDEKTVKLSDLQSGISLIANLEGFEPGINDLLDEIANNMQSRNNNSGSSSSTTTKTITAPVTGDTGTVSVTATVKGTDATIAPLTAAQVDSIVGSGSQSSTVAIDVSNLGTTVKAVTIPAETVKAIEAAVSDTTKDADSLTVKLTEGSVTFDADALKAIAAETKSDGLKVNLDDIGTEKLNTVQKSAVSDLAVETVLDAYVTSGSTRISDFKGGSATVSVKHTLKADQRPAGIVVWYVADNGTRTQIPATFRDGEVVFTVTHFSNYVIAYDAERAENRHLNCPQDETCPISKFTDADPTAWYHDGVHYVLENGIMSGYGNGLFGPGNTTNRAMMAQILWNMEGKPVVNYAISYTDVDAEAWYTEAVRWVTSEKIMSGYGGGKFGPGDAMTREQLVTIMYRYAQYKGVDVSVGEDTNILSYDDALTVSEFAIPAMQWAVGSGVVSGRTNTTLNPKDTATRAEIATIIMRYCTEIAK
ncbi:MAG: S-layer homology domain-containing protein [Oscillospiraceae bacterium]|nr:S-layer homology domain-containing protein [Oscillospiraceae bacterium]